MVRQLSAGDYDAIIEIWDRAGLHQKPRGRDSREEIERQMSHDPPLFQGCFVDDRMVGVIIGTFDGRKGYINRLAVIPEMQRKGVATALVREIENIFADRRVKVITLLIEDQSQESIELFRKLGYYLHDDITYWSKRESQDV